MTESAYQRYLHGEPARVFYRLPTKKEEMKITIDSDTPFRVDWEDFDRHLPRPGMFIRISEPDVRDEPEELPVHLL